MGMFTSLGLRRPAPPRPSAQGSFRLGGVTVINPMQGRRAAATLAVADGAIAEISDGSSDATLDFAGCFALPGLIDMHVHLPPDNALKLTPGTSLAYLAHGVTSLRDAGDLDGTSIDPRTLYETAAFTRCRGCSGAAPLSAPARRVSGTRSCCRMRAGKLPNRRR